MPVDSKASGLPARGEMRLGDLALLLHLWILPNFHRASADSLHFCWSTHVISKTDTLSARIDVIALCCLGSRIRFDLTGRDQIMCFRTRCSFAWNASHCCRLGELCDEIHDLPCTGINSLHLRWSAYIVSIAGTFSAQVNALALSHVETLGSVPDTSSAGRLFAPAVSRAGAGLSRR